MATELATVSTDFGLMNAQGDATTTVFPTVSPTLTEPTQVAVTRSVINLRKSNGESCNSILLIPVIVGNVAAVLTGVRYIGWRRLPKEATQITTATADLWIPLTLAAFDANNAAAAMKTGVDTTALPSTYFFANTITAITASVTATANVDYQIVSGSTSTIGHIVLDTKGFEKLEAIYDLGANATAANTVYAML